MSVFKNATVVVVHGAWADGSSWEPVIRELQKQGLNVVAAPIPLTSLSDDAAALRRTIARTEGPVILAGHAYAGAVIAMSNDERVKALVYVSALAPDEGETVAEASTGTSLIRTPHSLLLMGMASSGCRTRALSRLLPRTRRRNRSPCAELYNGRSH